MSAAIWSAGYRRTSTALHREFCETFCSFVITVCAATSFASVDAFASTMPEIHQFCLRLVDVRKPEHTLGLNKCYVLEASFTGANAYGAVLAA